MAANYNKVILAGNLTRDPQVKFLTNERAVANFALAINRRWRGQDGNKKRRPSSKSNVGSLAELVGQYLTKGRQALVEGRLKLVGTTKLARNAAPCVLLPKPFSLLVAAMATKALVAAVTTVVVPATAAT